MPRIRTGHVHRQSAVYWDTAKLAGHRTQFFDGKDFKKRVDAELAREEMWARGYENTNMVSVDNVPGSYKGWSSDFVFTDLAAIRMGDTFPGGSSLRFTMGDQPQIEVPLELLIRGFVLPAAFVLPTRQNYGLSVLQTYLSNARLRLVIIGYHEWDDSQLDELVQKHRDRKEST